MKMRIASLIAEIKHKVGEESPASLQEKRSAYQKAEKEFQAFRDALQIRDQEE